MMFLHLILKCIKGGYILRNYKKIIFYIFILLIVLTLIYYSPKKFNKEYNGVIYRLGDSSYSKNIKISFDGYLSKRLFKGDKFQGAIKIGIRSLQRYLWNLAIGMMHLCSIMMKV